MAESWGNTQHDARRYERDVTAGADRAAKRDHPRVEDVAADLAAHEERARLAREAYHATLARHAAQTRLDSLDMAAERAMMATVAFHRSLNPVYRDPDHAREAFLAVAAERGGSEAVRRLRDEPERFGALATERRSMALGLWHREDDSRARGAAPIAAAKGSEALSAEHNVGNVIRTVRSQRLESDRADDLLVVQHFSRELHAIYRDLSRAHAEFDQVVRQHGEQTAVDALRDRPWLYGQVRDELPEETRRQAAARAADIAPTALRAARELPDVESRLAREAGTLPRVPEMAAERDLGTGALERAMRREHECTTRLAELPRREVLERRLSETLRRLTPEESRQLATIATPSQMILATQLRDTARKIVLGDERGLGG